MPKALTVAGVGDIADVSSNRFNTPYSIALDVSNTMYVADFLNNRVQKWATNDIQGTTVAGLANGTSGSTPNTLIRPTSVIIDEDSNVYVSDSGNHRIQLFLANQMSGRTIAGVSTT